MQNRNNSIDIPFLATAVGSFPHDNVEEALALIFASLTEAPVWPQLPHTGLNEQMEIQYSEGMPRAIIDSEKGRLYFDTTGDYSEDFAVFYEGYLAAMMSEGALPAISPSFAKGLYALENRLKTTGKKFPFIKVHTTGPCSFALMVVDEKKRAIYYNEEFRDVIAKSLAMKCRWQIQKFRPYAERVICFIDEPILSALGSSTYISVKREEVVALIGELVEAIHADNAIAGVHCCGNTDWAMVIETGVDIINFDAFAFGETIALYHNDVRNFLQRGGNIAWGIAPTFTKIREESAQSLAVRLENLLDNLAEKTGLAKTEIFSRSLITPACGVGSLTIADAERVLLTLRAVSEQMKVLYNQIV